MQSTSILDPVSPQAQSIASLFLILLGVAAVIFLIVAGLVVYIAIRFRAKPGASEPYQDHGNPKLEILWTAIPALILFVMLMFTARAMFVINPPLKGKKPDVTVVAHQWWWEYRYPEHGIVTANEMHMPVNQKWLIDVTLADVVHDFWVPRLGAKVDAIPNNTNHIWVDAGKTGDYDGSCAEYCGEDHALMQIRVVVDSPEAFQEWLDSQSRVPGPPTNDVARRGENLFQERTCGSCHAIAGTQAQRRVGPDLTHVATRSQLAAGVLTNSHDHLVDWLMNPQAVKPGCHMPNLHLNHDDAEAIATYLEDLR